jgi:phosphocarrier protein HPr
MIKTSVTISNKLGLHARASAKLTKLAASFRSDVHLSRNGRRINAKSIMGVMMLAAGQGSELDLEVAGDDEAAATQAILTLFEERFGEAE